MIRNVPDGTHMGDIEVIVDRNLLSIKSAPPLNLNPGERILGKYGAMQTEPLPVQRPDQIQIGNHGRCRDIPYVVLPLGRVV